MEKGDEIVITRILDAPRERVWEACTQKEQLREWWGQPKGATMPVCELDFRVGGSLFFKVEIPDGMVVWAKAIYTEIKPPEKIVLRDYFSDENGVLIDTKDMPASTITLLLEDQGAKTKLTVKHEMRGGIHATDQYKEGWAQSLDRLVTSLIH